MEKVRLNVAEITPGMKLAEPITNAGGITLMPAGIRLTPMFISRIKKWNIEALDVLMEKKKPDTAQRPKPKPKTAAPADAAAAPAPAGAMTPEQEEFARNIAADVSRVFVNVRKNELMMALRAIAIKRLVLEGPDAVINILRRGPQDTVPLPGEKA